MRGRTVASHAPVLALAVLAGCLSQGPPAPPVRFFDPLPVRDASPGDVGSNGAGAAAEARAPGVAVFAGPRVRQEFVLRTAPRELVIDDQHRWIAPPERLVAEALERALAGTPAGDGDARAMRVHLSRFEFELFANPRAVVELQLAVPGRSVPCTGAADATASTPEALADAMARALAEAVDECARQLRAR